MLTEIIPRQNKTTKAEKQQQEPSTDCLETFVFNVDFFLGGEKTAGWREQMSNARLLFWVRTRQTNLTVKRAATSPRLGRGEDFFFFFFGRERCSLTEWGTFLVAMHCEEHDGMEPEWNRSVSKRVYDTTANREKERKKVHWVFSLAGCYDTAGLQDFKPPSGFPVWRLQTSPFDRLLFFSIKRWISSFLIDTFW